MTLDRTRRSLRGKVLNGTAWTMGGFAVAQVLRLFSNIILARLLFAEAFALMALVATVLQGLVMLSDIGLGPNIVQSKRGDEKAFLNTAWTMQIIRGAVLAIVATCLAWPVAAFYAANDPAAWQLLWIIPLVSLGSFIQSFQSTKLKSANRHLSLSKITLLQLFAQVLGIVVMLVLAWLTRSVYSMVLGGIVTAVTISVLSHTYLDGEKNEFQLEKKSLHEIVHFGKWIFVSTMLSFFAMQFDKLALARMFPLSEVGVYGIAVSLSMLAATLMAKIQLGIAFPLYARTMENDESLSLIVSKSKPIILVAGGYVVSILVACGASFIDLAYDDRYSAAGVYLPILAYGAWFAVVEGVYSAAFLAVGKSRWVAIGNAVKVFTFAAMLVPVSKYGGMIGVIICSVLSDFLKLPFAIYFGRKISLPSATLELKHTMLLSASAFAALVMSAEISRNYVVSTFALFVMQALIVTCVYAVPFARTYRQLKK